MNYCSSCGGEVVKVLNTKYTCKKCGLDHYINPKAAVAAFVVLHTGEVALAVRGEEPYKGKLDCLGGFLDVGENFEQALYRELQEESGITASDVISIEYVASVYDDYPWGDIVVPVTSAYYIAMLKPGVKLVANDDVATIKTIQLEVLSPDNFAWDGMKQIFGEAVIAIDLLRVRS